VLATKIRREYAAHSIGWPQNWDLCRKFITRRRLLNFGTVVEGRNGRNNIKNLQVENSYISFKYFEFLNFDTKYLEKSHMGVFEIFIALSTKLTTENTNMQSNQNRK